MLSRIGFRLFSVSSRCPLKRQRSQLHVIDFKTSEFDDVGPFHYELYFLIGGQGDKLGLCSDCTGIVEVCGLWVFWVRIQSCFANFQSESAPDPVPTRQKQSGSCLTPHEYKSSKQPVTFFPQTQNSKSNPAHVSSGISCLRNRWLHPICAGTHGLNIYVNKTIIETNSERMWIGFLRMWIGFWNKTLDRIWIWKT